MGITKPKTGVLLVNLGTPDATDYWSMRRYLNQFLSDRRVIDYPRWKWQPLLQLIILSKRPFSSGKAYRSIWNDDANESPLLTITKAQTALVRTALGEDIEVDYAMRYGNPSVESRLRALADKGCDRVLYFPLYPQYAGATTGTANDAAFKVLTKMNAQPALRTVPPYFDQPEYIASLAASVRETYNGMAVQPDTLVVSYHGLPERYITNGDPYYRHCAETTRLLQAELGFSDGQIVMTFQSKFGPEEWIKPATAGHVAELANAGKTNIAVIAPGFAADCIETLEEINEEIRESFEAAGGKGFTYIPCLNDRDDHINALVSVIGTELSGWV